MHLTPPEIRCHFSRLAAPGTLRPHPSNPNAHPPEQLRLYGKILSGSGWRWPIVVSRRSGCIVRGHGAWAVAQSNAWAKVPIEEQDFANETEEITYLLADNQLAKYANPDKEAVEQLVLELRRQSFDLELAGILAKPPAAAAEKTTVTPQLQVLVHCANEAQQLQVLVELGGRGLTVRPQIS